MLQFVNLKVVLCLPLPFLSPHLVPTFLQFLEKCILHFKFLSLSWPCMSVSSLSSCPNFQLLFLLGMDNTHPVIHIHHAVHKSHYLPICKPLVYFYPTLMAISGVHAACPSTLLVHCSPQCSTQVHLDFLSYRFIFYIYFLNLSISKFFFLYSSCLWYSISRHSCTANL